MDWPGNCLAIIPCLNEAATIAQVVDGVRRRVPSVLVVDDGSTDATAALAVETGAKVLRHERNLGKGAALQTGWRHAQQRGFSWALMMDGDGQHSAEDIPLFFQMAERTRAALVSGNRMNDAAQMPWLRRQTNRWMSRQLSRAAGIALPDSQCGFRLVHFGCLSGLPIATNRFEIESEVLLAFAANGHRISFVGIRALYKQERSKIHPIKDAIRWLRWWQSVRHRPALDSAALPAHSSLAKQLANS